MAKRQQPVRTPRGTNNEVVALWLHDWVGDMVPEKQRFTEANTLCYRLRIDPEALVV